MSNEAVYEYAPKSDEPEGTTSVEVEQSDRGLFGFGGKKDEEKKCEDEVIATEFEQKVQVSEPEPEPEPESEEKKESLFAKLHRSNSSSSSSSDEEEGEDGEKKKKKKKPIKEKIADKIEEYKEKKEEKKVEKYEADTYVPVEKYQEVPVPPSTAEVVDTTPTPAPDEKKGFMEKIKDKLPGGHKKSEEGYVAPPPPPSVAVTHDEEGEQKDKKGIFEKIKEKIPGYHSKSEEEKEKEKVKECD